MFNEVRLAETPTTDPATLVGRNLEIGVSELMSQPAKYYMKVFFKITDVDSRNAYTRFNGYATTREYLYRVVRKRNQKVESVDTFLTRDGWKLQITSIAILNRNTNDAVQKKVRVAMVKHIEESAKKSGTDDLVKRIIEGSLQKEIRKIGSKIYPVRFCEIAKIEVAKAPAK
jgi:small subunit ribosomal protein S3Ae